MKKRLSVLDGRLWDLADKHYPTIAIIILIFGSVLIRVHMAPLTISGDYQGFLTDWYNAYASEGLWQSFSHSITTYYEPYSFLMDIFAHIPLPLWLSIAITSCLAEYVTVLYAWRILELLNFSKENTREKGRSTLNKIAAVVLLYLPMTIMNGALWKQCDSIYTCFIVISLYHLFKENYGRSFFCLSIAFVFKLQTGFILPFYVMVYLCKKSFSIVRFLYLPAAYILTGLPAVILQRGIRATYGKYLMQYGYLDMISSSTPSIWRIGMKDYESFATPAVVITVMVLTIGMVVVMYHRETISNRCLLYLSGWTIWTCFIFLPKMHERYDYAALVILTFFMIAYRRRVLWTMIIANLCTAMTYGYYLFENLKAEELFTMLQLAVPYNLAYFVVTADLLKLFREDRLNPTVPDR